MTKSTGAKPITRLLRDVTALLDSKIHKIRLAAITHTHRDHCAGLMQLLNLRGGAGDFTVLYPEGSDHQPRVQRAVAQG